MPDQKEKNNLQEALAQKTTRELENMLVEDFASDGEPNAERIRTVMEVMLDRLPETEEEKKKAEAARLKVLAAIRSDSQTFEKAGIPEEPPSQHTCSTEHRQNAPKSFRRPLRYLLIAAAVVVLFAFTAVGRNWFSVIAQWTAETFHFETGRISEEMPKTDAFLKLELPVSIRTERPSVPCRAPEGTEMVGSVTVTDRPDNCRIQARFSRNNGEFTIQYIIHDAEPDDTSGTYQRDEEMEVIHEAGGIRHYITGDLDNLSVMWINGTVEGHIQGDLTLEELTGMLDSIYEE